MIWLVAIAAILVMLFGFIIFIGAPYVPSRKKYINTAFNELYCLSKHDILVDIGSGDGVVLRAASKVGAKAIGYEVNPLLVLISYILSKNDRNVEVHLTDFWLAHLPPKTTVIYVFSVKRDMSKLKNWIEKETKRINKTIYVISFGFEFKEMSEIKKASAYHLYRFQPLHAEKAQV